MSIARRIAAAERSVASPGVGDHVRLLIELAGRRDGLFWPQREPGDAFVAARQRQRGYLDGSVGLSAKADGRSQWRPSHDLRNRLADEGLVTPLYSGGQITSVLVTEQGDAVCRAVVGPRLASVRDALPLLAIIMQAEGRPHCGRTWTMESDLVGQPLVGDPSDWERLTEHALPLLIRGIIVSNCDRVGRVGYSLNSEAVDRVEGELTVEGVSPIPEAETWYLDSFESEAAALRHAEPSDPSELVIPLPVSW